MRFSLLAARMPAAAVSFSHIHAPASAFRFSITAKAARNAPLFC